MAFLDTKNFLRLRRVNSLLMRVVIQTFTKMRKNKSIKWKFNLDVDSLILEQFKKSKIASLVSVFQVNILDLSSLMILPDMLTVIQEKLLQDRRLLIDFGLMPTVSLTNHVNEIFLDDAFDSFELANKFSSLSRVTRDIKLFTILNKMDFSCELSRRIVSEFALSLDDIQLDQTILVASCALQTNIIKDVLDQLIQKSENLYIDSDTVDHLNSINSRSMYTNVKKLNIFGVDKQKESICQLLMQFPQIETLDIQNMYVFDSTFFDGFKQYFRNNDTTHLKNLKFDFWQFFVIHDQDTISGLYQLFQVIAGIQAPQIDIKYKVSCNGTFPNQILSSDIFQLFDGCKISTDYVNFATESIQAREQFSMSLVFRKDMEVAEKFVFNITIKKKDQN
eukprot:403342610